MIPIDSDRVSGDILAKMHRVDTTSFQFFPQVGCMVVGLIGEKPRLIKVTKFFFSRAELVTAVPHSGSLTGITFGAVLILPR